MKSADTSTFEATQDAAPVDKVPIELEPGNLGCPDCRCPLEPGLLPFYHKGHKLGAFDGVVCKMCGYGLLTEKGYDESGAAIEAFGTVLRPRAFVDVVETQVTSMPCTTSSTRVTINAEDPPSTRDATLQIPIVTISRQRKPAQMRFA